MARQELRWVDNSGKAHASQEEALTADMLALLSNDGTAKSTTEAGLINPALIRHIASNATELVPLLSDWIQMRMGQGEGGGLPPYLTTAITAVPHHRDHAMEHTA